MTGTFRDLSYTRPDFDAVQAQYDGLAAQIEQAADYTTVRNAIMEQQRIANEVSLAVTIVYARCYGDSSDTFYAKEFAEVMARVSLLSTERFNQAQLDSPFAGDIDAEFGTQYLNAARRDVRLHSKGKAQMAREQELIAEYQQLKAGLKFEFDGETYSEAALMKLRDSLDRDVRTRVLHTYYQGLLAHKERFVRLLDELVDLRLAIARENGFDSYLDYANDDYGREGYGEAELSAFCAQVKRDLVPFCSMLRKKQAERLGLPSIEPQDTTVLFPDGNAEPAGDAQYLLEAAKRMYAELSPETDSCFTTMLEHGLLDIAASPNKISGMGFCTALEPFRLPYIFGNCNGTSWDVTVLTHEVGHAFQAWLAMQVQPLSEYFFGCNDIAEVPSKTMELFAHPYAEGFFGVDADKFRLSHHIEALSEITGYCAIHEYESWLYTHPGASFEERVANFRRVMALYDPEVGDGEYTAELEQGASMFRNMAIYMFPRYVISYSLSAMCAMEFAKRMAEDRDGAWQAYLRLCRAGGSLSYPELLKLAGLHLAYEDGAVARSTAYVQSRVTEQL